MKSGFTLIELLVVVLIIAILSAVALPQYTAAVEKSRATEALLVGKAFVDAAQRYNLMHDSWPESFNELDITPPAGYTINGATAKSDKFEIWLDGSRVPPGLRLLRVNSSGTRIDYYFWWDMSGQRVNPRTCNTFNLVTPVNGAKGKRVCESLGGTLLETGVWAF
ncbi:prepilin-type N-terminal cleavage/methylation domain-containing protein [Parelusimicrobium proximum]|uniref:type IV pilin protein n=1 Tax=Parelusimicrobium proximum TaxID=3228953 RepID=UPI003D1863B2